MKTDIRVPISKLLAIIPVGIGVALMTSRSSATFEARINSMSPADYVQYVQAHHHHLSSATNLFFSLLLSALFIGVYELFAYVTGLLIPERRHRGY
jgi:hypothetical protein